jgi:hypothetical protein
MQALRFSRASAKEGGATKSLAIIVLGSMFLRYGVNSPFTHLVLPLSA